jgi:putative transposase
MAANYCFLSRAAAEFVSPTRQCWGKAAQDNPSLPGRHGSCKQVQFRKDLLEHAPADRPIPRDLVPPSFHDNRMGHTYTDVFVHCIFSTKGRMAAIPEHLQQQLWAYLHGIAKNLNVETLAIGGITNHVHMLLLLPPTLRLSELVQKLKSNSSRWIGEHGIQFSWQQGYGAFSVSPSMLHKTKDYIHAQAEHHRRRSFDDEFLAMLRNAGMQHDPAVVFD